MPKVGGRRVILQLLRKKPEVKRKENKMMMTQLQELLFLRKENVLNI